MRAFNPRYRFIIGLALLAADFLLLFVLPFHPAVSLAIVFTSSSALYLLIAWHITRNDVSLHQIYGALALAVILRLMFLFTTPIGSDDFYRYQWDGRVQASGVNPYRYAPQDSALTPLHTAHLPSAVNHPEFKTVYFPLSLWTFYVSYELCGEEIWGYKLMLLCAELVALWGLTLIVRARQIDMKYVLLYALCPLPIVQFAIDAHLDGLGLPFLVFGLYLFLTHRKLLSAVSLGLSMSIKPVALVMLPMLVLRERAWKHKLLFAVVPLVAVAVQFVPYVVGVNPFEPLFAFAKNWSFNGVVFEAVNAVVVNNQRARLICGALLCGALLVLCMQKPLRTLDTLYFAVLLLFLFSPVVHPWYINWLAVLVPVVRKWSGIALGALASLTTTTTLPFILTGVWHQSGWILALEYMPVIALMVMELRAIGRATGAKTA